MKTITVLIGNSDDKLTQREWSLFCQKVEKSFQFHSNHVHFIGASGAISPYQTLCAVGEIEDNDIADLKKELESIRVEFRQEAIAIVEGTTSFVGAAPEPPKQELANAKELEMDEYLFSDTAADYAEREKDKGKVLNHVRGALRLHRFQVFAWLLHNGVKLPTRLLDDRAHPAVGSQTPDHPANPEPSR